jgi:hypothetical protein
MRIALAISITYSQAGAFQAGSGALENAGLL